MSILLDHKEIDIIKQLRPDVIVEEKKAGMFIRATLKDDFTLTDIYSLGRQVAFNEFINLKNK
jgi:hypothetical protein